MLSQFIAFFFPLRMDENRREYNEWVNTKVTSEYLNSFDQIKSPFETMIVFF